jgi:hypothetical protein
MAELIINIAPEKEHLIKLLVQELGGEIIEEKKSSNKAKGKSVAKKASLKKKEKEVSPTFLFGKWKDLDLDAKKLREDAWDRSHKFL